MQLIGLFLGGLAFCLVGSFTGELATHNAQAGFLPGIAAAIWAAWPFYHKHKVGRVSFLHPMPKAYSRTSADAFEALFEMLRTTVYRIGDSWKIVSANTQTNHLIADLQYYDEEFQINTQSGLTTYGHKAGNERVRRFLRLEAQFKDTADGKTIVQFDFDPRIEGSDDHACDPVIRGVIAGFEKQVGEGTTVAGDYSNKLPGPPWWLVGFTGLTALCFVFDVIKNMFGMH